MLKLDINSGHYNLYFIIMIYIIGFLKKSLVNNRIQFNIKIKELEKQEIKAYTPEDKFKEMAEKNPALLKMKDQFGLELDY